MVSANSAQVSSVTREENLWIMCKIPEFLEQTYLFCFERKILEIVCFTAQDANDFFLNRSIATLGLTEIYERLMLSAYHNMLRYCLGPFGIL